MTEPDDVLLTSQGTLAVRGEEVLVLRRGLDWWRPVVSQPCLLSMSSVSSL